MAGACTRKVVCSAFLRARQEIRAAKTIFHVSGWQTRHRFVVVACRGWDSRGSRGNFVPLGSFQSILGSWFTPDHKRRSNGGRIYDADCGDANGALFSGNSSCMVSRARYGFARRKNRSLGNDHRGYGTGDARPGSLFARWTIVRTPRDCNSTSIATTRILIPVSSIVASLIKS